MRHFARTILGTAAAAAALLASSAYAGELSTPVFRLGAGSIRCTALNLNSTAKDVTITLFGNSGVASAGPTTCASLAPDNGCALAASPIAGDYWCHFSFLGGKAKIRGAANVLQVGGDPATIATAY